MEDFIADLISSLFGFQKVHNLGVLLFHQRVINSTLSFVVEKVHGKLQSWDAKKLSTSEHVTLAQLFLLAIPNYFMQSMMILRKVRDDIERVWLNSSFGVLRMAEGKCRLWDGIPFANQRSMGALG